MVPGLSSGPSTQTRLWYQSGGGVPYLRLAGALAVCICGRVGVHMHMAEMRAAFCAVSVFLPVLLLLMLPDRICGGGHKVARLTASLLTTHKRNGVALP